MGYPTKVQLIRRKQSQQWYVNFPAQLAQAMDFRAGEVVEWQIEDRGLLALVRRQVPESALKKKRRASSRSSSGSASSAGGPSSRRGPRSGGESSS
jgi:hypothetical protein